jgi:hypothetical protein
MLFGSSLPSRLRGLWDDTSFVVDFYIVSDPDSALGISIASNETDGFHTAPSVHNGDGRGSVSPCIQEGAMSSITLRFLHEALTLWHSSFFHTAGQIRAATPVSQAEALRILEEALDRPCCVSHPKKDTSCITTVEDTGFLCIAQQDLTDGTLDFHVRITLQGGCICAIDIDGQAPTPQRERALNDARLRLGLNSRPLPVSRPFAAAIVELIMTPLVPKDTAATPNLFSYLAAHLALSLKNSIVFANCHTGEVLQRPIAMPFVPITDEVSLFSIDNGMCGLSLQDALCCLPPDVLQLAFKSAGSASSQVSAGRGGSSGKALDLCQPWPTFLLKKPERNVFRSGFIEDAARRADKTENRLCSRANDSLRAEPAVAHMSAGLGVENKKLEEWQSSVSAALHALQDQQLINLMASARSGCPGLEQRKQVLQQFLSICASSCSAVAGVNEEMIQKVCGYILRTLPYFPAKVFDQLLWFGGTPWEDGLAEDVRCTHARERLRSPARSEA